MNLAPLITSPFRWSENQYRFTSLPSPPIHKGVALDEYGSNVPNDLHLPVATARSRASEPSVSLGADARARASGALAELIQSGFDEMDVVLAARRTCGHPRRPAATSLATSLGVPIRHSGVSGLMQAIECGARHPDGSSSVPSIACSDASASSGIKRTGSHLNINAACFIPHFGSLPSHLSPPGFSRVVSESSEHLPNANDTRAALALMEGHSPPHGMAPTDEEQEWLDRQVDAVDAAHAEEAQRMRRVPQPGAQQRGSAHARMLLAGRHPLHPLDSDDEDL